MSILLNEEAQRLVGLYHEGKLESGRPHYRFKRAECIPGASEAVLGTLRAAGGAIPKDALLEACNDYIEKELGKGARPFHSPRQVMLGASFLTSPRGPNAGPGLAEWKILRDPETGKAVKLLVLLEAGKLNENTEEELP